MSFLRNPAEIPMTRFALRTVALLCAALFLLAPLAYADSVTGRINENRARLFVFRASSFNQAVLTAMWKDADTDLDMIVYVIDEEGEVLPLGVGVASTANLERLVVGIGQGIDIYVLLSVFSGPPTSFQLNAQSTRTDELDFGPDRVRELSETDPRMAAGQGLLERMRTTLKPARERSR